jgi:hypothetical protein
MRGKVAAPFFFPLPHLLPTRGVGRRLKGLKAILRMESF